MPSCNTYCLTWVLLPWAWGISSQLLQQSTAIAPYLDKGYLLTAALPDLQCGIAPLGPPVPAQPPLLGCGVAPPGRRPWPRVWGSSSRLLPLTPDLGSTSRPFLHHPSLALLATAPDLGCGITPPGCCPLGMGSFRLLPLISDVG